MELYELWEKRNRKYEIFFVIKYLTQAKDLFIQECNNENITSFNGYQNRIDIVPI